MLQTVMAVISLPAFPIGTAFGLYALWVCWMSDAVEILEYPPLDEAPRARRPVRRVVAAEVEDVEEVGDDDDEATVIKPRRPAPRRPPPRRAPAPRRRPVDD